MVRRVFRRSNRPAHHRRHPHRVCASPSNSTPAFITVGRDRALWFTEREATGNRIGRITVDGAVTEFPLPTPGSRPGGITTGRDGNLWFTDLAGSAIGRMTPAGVFTEFPLPHPNSSPNVITVGADHKLWVVETDGDLWFTEQFGNNIARLEVDDGDAHDQTAHHQPELP